MATIHDEIDNWLAADLHDELSEAERQDLHTHLVECSTCRRIHQETKTMDKALHETFFPEAPDPRFEERIISRFRKAAPLRRNLMNALVNLGRWRPMQIGLAACLVFALAGIGKWLTTPTFLG